MSIATQDLLAAVSEITEIREMKVALCVTGQCGIITAITTIAGGLIGGPPGIAIGGFLGTVLATCHANGKFKSVPEILLHDASPKQKESLANAIRDVLTTENILTIVQLAACLQNNRSLVEVILKVYMWVISIHQCNSFANHATQNIIDEIHII